jgi:TonB family protein
MGSLFPILTMLAAAAAPQTPATETHDDYVRASQNGEFLSAYYPEGALKRGEEGTVWFKIGIEKEGWISSCEITQSSGYQALDRETCEIMVQYARVKPVRTPEGRIVRAIQDGRIAWQLPASATRSATAPSFNRTRKPDPIMCRRDNTTGSMVAKTIQCLTRSEWELQQGFTQDTWREFQGKGHSTGG